ncbi:hypothetical protein HDU67_008290 [Dinochytrium kinnereticum]|nr:hypothetical protein HDU67_008290 [Dinochytrium kinnereticum]
MAPSTHRKGSPAPLVSSTSSRKAPSKRQRRAIKELRSSCIHCGRDFAMILLHGDSRDLSLEDHQPVLLTGTKSFSAQYVCNSCCFANGEPTSAGEGVPAVPRNPNYNPYPNPKTLPSDAVVPIQAEGEAPPLQNPAPQPPNKDSPSTLSCISSSLSKARKRNRMDRNEDGPDCEVSCSACSRVLGRGGCRVDYRPSSLSPPPESSKDDSFGRVSNTQRWQLPPSVIAEPVCPSCFEKYAFCTACGAGGQYRIGKWRPKEMFQGGRKCCTLSHVRVQNVGREGTGVERPDRSHPISSPLYFETRCIEDDEDEAIVMEGEDEAARRARFLATLHDLVAEIKQERLDSLLTDVAVPQVMERAKGYGRSYQSIVDFQLKSTTLQECLSAPRKEGVRRYVRTLYYDHALAAAAFSTKGGGGSGGVAEGKKTIVAYAVAIWDVSKGMLLFETMYDRRATRTGRQYECRISSDTLTGLLDHLQRDCDRLNAATSPPLFHPPNHIWLWALRHKHDTVGQALNGSPSRPHGDETATDATDFSLRRLGFRPLNEHIESCGRGSGGVGGRPLLPPIPVDRKAFLDYECHFVSGYEKKVFMVYAADARVIRSTLTNR